jgi:serine/threonine protein phosphatase 1
VHAGVKPGESFWRTPALLKLWGVNGFMESDYDWGKPVVFGHMQLPAPLMQPNKIGIDTGAYRTGILTAVRLPDRTIFQVRREEKRGVMKEVIP